MGDELIDNLVDAVDSFTVKLVTLVKRVLSGSILYNSIDAYYIPRSGVTNVALEFNR